MSDNEFDAVRALRADAPPPSAGTLGTARSQLTDAIDAPVPITTPPTRRWLPALAAAAVIAAVAGGAVALSSRHDARAPSAATTPTTPAATRHHRAAPAVAAFQVVTTHSWDISEAVLGPRSVWYSSEGTSRTWVPADRSDTWYWRTRYNTGTRFLTTDDAEYVKANHPELLKPGSDNTSGKDGMTAGDIAPPDCSATAQVNPSTSASGVHVVTGDDGGNCALDVNWEWQTADWIATLPADPATLRTSVYSAAARLVDEAVHYGKPADVDSQAFQYLGRLLAVGYLPADLQAALYQVVASIPGVTTDDTVTTLDGVAGVGLRHGNNLDDEQDELIFSAPGGTYLGARNVVTSDDWLAHHDSTGAQPVPTTQVPVGTVVNESSVSVTTADAPPAD